jgi:hypothetical protein
MKRVKKTALALAVLLLTIFVVSCSTTGEYLPLTSNETVIGTVQTTFAAQSSFFFMKKVRDAINTEAYIMLMEAAERKYPDSNIDIRDIVWVTGKSVDYQNTEIVATGKVVQAK